MRKPPTEETLALEKRVKETGAVMRAFPRKGPFNLPTDATLASAEYRAAKAAYDAAFTVLRNHNAARCR